MRLIIVEDEGVFAENLKKLLELKGFAVDWLPSADKAYNRILLYQNEYDAVLLDLNMAGMNGMELTRKLRAENVSVPILILTGDSATESKIELLNSGADDYIVKPFSVDELVARINSVMRRPEVSIPTTLSAGDITMDPSSRSVKVADKEVMLSLKEYALLECFMRHPGEVLSREQLINKVWDFSALTLSNVLDVHMVSLRKKIKDAEESARLETIRGIGYRLAV
jgi:two-component system, OmpR family, response regulator